MGRSAQTLRAAVHADSLIVVNTHLHSDHTGGNRLFPEAYVVAGAYTREQWTKAVPRAKYPDRTLLPGEEITFPVGAERVRVRNLGRGHTHDDVVVYLENHKLLLTGDLVFRNSHPFLLTRDGCRVDSWMRALHEADSLFSEVRTLVAGHGALADQSALQEMRDYFVSAREAAGDAEKVAALKQKYRDRLSIPGVTGMEKTVTFVATEQTAKP